MRDFIHYSIAAGQIKLKFTTKIAGGLYFGGCESYLTRSGNTLFYYN
jgi:hypothetical protein